MNRPSSRLATAVSDRHTQALARADAAADTVDRAVVRAWNRLMALLRTRPTAWEAHRVIAPLVAQLLHAAHDSIGQELTGLAQWGYTAAADSVVQTLPLKYLKAVALRRHRSPVREAMDPGLISFTTDPATGQLQTRNHLAALAGLPDDEQRELLRQLLFPAPDQTFVARVLKTPIAGHTWQQDLSHATKLANPSAWVHLIVSGFAAGKNPREIAQALLPAVQGVKTTARRLARTYGMEVAHAVQMDAHSQLGDLIVGYQCHSAKFPTSRPWHVARDGVIYYLHPTGDQKGPRQMPHPPLEPEDPAERPAKAPRTAWNCMCWLSPVLRPLD